MSKEHKIIFSQVMPGIFVAECQPGVAVVRRLPDCTFDWVVQAAEFGLHSSGHCAVLEGARAAASAAAEALGILP